MMQGPEIRTGFLENAKPIQLTAGKEVTLTTDYEKKGNADLIAVRSDSASMEDHTSGLADEYQGAVQACATTLVSCIDRQFWPAVTKSFLLT